MVPIPDTPILGCRTSSRRFSICSSKLLSIYFPNFSLYSIVYISCDPVSLTGITSDFFSFGLINNTIIIPIIINPEEILNRSGIIIYTARHPPSTAPNPEPILNIVDRYAAIIVRCPYGDSLANIVHSDTTLSPNATPKRIIRITKI